MEYTIKNAKFTATVNELGGELTMLKGEDGTNYIWNADEQYWPKSSPFLFPIVSALKNDEIDINGTAYTMQKHGFARNLPWNAVDIKEDFIALELVQTQETLKQYPFNFVFRVEHALNDKGFKTTMKVFNKSDDSMIFCVGGHPGFHCPLFKGEQFSDYELVFEKEENPSPLYCNSKSILDGKRTQPLLMQNNTVLPLEYSLFDIDALIFDSVNSRKITLRHKEKHHGIEFSYEGLPHLGVWSPPHKNAPFICLEPWKGLPAFDDETGKFEDKPDSVILEKNGVFCASYSMQII